MPPDVPSMPQASDRHVGWAAVLAGITLAFGLQVLAPVGVPLYDGVAVQEPYRFLHPTGDEAGEPTSFAAKPEVVGGASPELTAATAESPPQVQLVALLGAFVLPEGASSLDVSVTPIEPPAEPPGGEIAGNVYRISVTDQAGTPVSISTCDGCVSLVMRAPDGTGDARIQRYANGAWAEIPTIHAGIVGLYATNPTVLGDYAIVTTVPGAGDGESEQGIPFEQLVVAGGAGVLLVLLFGAALLARRRDAPRPPPRPRSRAVPSKRQRPNPPPPGRTER